MSVCSGATVAVSEEIFSDQKRSNQDLVGSESCKRGDPKNGSSWASIVGASSDEDENTGISFRSDTAGADKVFPAGAGATDNNEGQAKFISAAGKVWSADVARSGVRKKGPVRAWVKCLRKTSPTGPDLSSSIEEPATTVNQTRKSAGGIGDSIHTTSDQRSSTPQRLDSGPFEGKIHPEFSCLGLGDEDFPPIRLLSNLGTNKEASVNVGGTVQSKSSAEVKPSLISDTTRSQSVQMGSRVDKEGFW